MDIGAPSEAFGRASPPAKRVVAVLSYELAHSFEARHRLTCMTDPVNEYLNAFYSGDHDRASRCVADQFEFCGPFVQARDRRSFFKSAAPLAKAVGGHHVLRQWRDGDEVCTIFDLKLGTGTVTMCEWHRLCDGKIASIRVLFDTVTFRERMAG